MVSNEIKLEAVRQEFCSNLTWVIFPRLIVRKTMAMWDHLINSFLFGEFDRLININKYLCLLIYFFS